MAAKYSQRLGRGFTGTVHQLSQSQQLLTRWRLRLDDFLAFGPQFFNITFHFLPESPVSDPPKQATFSLDRYLPNPSNFSTRRNHFVFDGLLGNPTAPQPPQSSALLPSHGSLEMLPTMTVSELWPWLLCRRSDDTNFCKQVGAQYTLLTYLCC